MVHKDKIKKPSVDELLDAVNISSDNESIDIPTHIYIPSNQRKILTLYKYQENGHSIDSVHYIKFDEYKRRQLVVLNELLRVLDCGIDATGMAIGNCIEIINRRET